MRLLVSLAVAALFSALLLIPDSLRAQATVTGPSARTAEARRQFQQTRSSLDAQIQQRESRGQALKSQVEASKEFALEAKRQNALVGKVFDRVMAIDTIINTQMTEALALHPRIATANEGLETLQTSLPALDTQLNAIEAAQKSATEAHDRAKEALKPKEEDKKNEQKEDEKK